MALYGERGFDNTTVAEIAERAGLTERTFFRHFADKREVLFAGANLLQDHVVSAVQSAPESWPPIDAAIAGVDAAGELLADRQPFARQRRAIIEASAELRERELIKLASLSAALADALRGRGTPDPTAGLVAEIAIAVFRIAFERWTTEGENRGFPELVRESLEQLRAATAREVPAGAS
jgi:AcrR family transcriptional regulator